MIGFDFDWGTTCFLATLPLFPNTSITRRTDQFSRMPALSILITLHVCTTRWIKHLPSDVFNELVVVDCDTGTVHAPHIAPCPRTIRRRLIKAVREVTLLDFDFREPWKDNFSTPLCKRKVPSCSREAVEVSERHMQYAFVKAMADLLYGFTDCLFFVEQNRPIFNSTRFLNEYAEEDHVPFISCVIDTLAFTFFMENHDAPHLYSFMKLMSSARKEALLRGEFTHRGHPITHEEGDWNNNNNPLQMSNDCSIPTMVVPNVLLDEKMFMLDADPIEVNIYILLLSPVYN